MVLSLFPYFPYSGGALIIALFSVLLVIDFLRSRAQQLLGYTVVSLPFLEWDQLTKSDERKAYLKSKLHIS